MEHHQIIKLLNDLSVSKFVVKNGLNEMIYQAVNICLTKL